MLSSHELVDLRERLHEMDRRSVYDFRSKSVAIIFPDLEGQCGDLFEVGLSVSFVPALRGIYVPAPAPPWPAFRREAFTLSALTPHLPGILKDSACEAYLQHADDLIYLFEGRANSEADRKRAAELRQRVERLRKIRGEFVDMYVGAV